MLAPPMSTLPTDSEKDCKRWSNIVNWEAVSRLPCATLIYVVQEICLGGEQSGFMAEIGFEMYQKILDEAISELKRTDFKESV